MMKMVAGVFQMFLIFLICQSLVFGLELHVCKSQIVNTTCEHKCLSSDLNLPVIIRKDGDNQGSCLSAGNCHTNIPGYTIFSSGTNKTILRIASYDRIRDPGRWSCTNGAITSAIKTTHYAIPPARAELVNGPNITVNETTHIVLNTACAYTDIFGIIQFYVDRITHNFTGNCTRLSSSGCAVGSGEKYSCSIELSPTSIVQGTYRLVFRVDLPYDDTDPIVPLSQDGFVSFVVGEQRNSGDTQVAIIIGTTIGTVVVIAVIACISYKGKKRKRKNKSSDDPKTANKTASESGIKDSDGKAKGQENVESMNNQNKPCITSKLQKQAVSPEIEVVDNKTINATKAKMKQNTEIMSDKFKPGMNDKQQTPLGLQYDDNEDFTKNKMCSEDRKVSMDKNIEQRAMNGNGLEQHLKGSKKVNTTDVTKKQ